MRVFVFALRGLVRQPARTALGVLGIAGIGALLLDMLLLSRGLAVSLKTLLDTAGFDVRVRAVGDMVPVGGPKIPHASAAVAAISSLPEVDEVIPFSLGSATARDPNGRLLDVHLVGVEPRRRRTWTLVAGKDLDEYPQSLLVNRSLARALGASPGAFVTLRGTCSGESVALPTIPLRISGIVDVPFDEALALTALARTADFRRVCGSEERDEADLLVVASREGHTTESAVRSIERVRPDLHAFSNEELVERFQQAGFSYFRQISVVLSTVTLFFGFLLVTVLLTVSVNQRFAEIATLRALGFSKKRVVLDVLCQAALLVATGGVLSLPLGLGLSVWFDGILRAMPGIPMRLHFFVFEPRALILHAVLLTATAVGAAFYPMRLVARLNIAGTLRSEVVT